jgi:hypothetical protein
MSFTSPPSHSPSSFDDIVVIIVLLSLFYLIYRIVWLNNATTTTTSSHTKSSTSSASLSSPTLPPSSSSSSNTKTHVTPSRIPRLALPSSPAPSTPPLMSQSSSTSLLSAGPPLPLVYSPFMCMNAIDWSIARSHTVSNLNTNSARGSGKLWSHKDDDDAVILRVRFLGGSNIQTEKVIK